MKFLIGIDDADNKENQGKGFRSGKMGALIEEKGLGSVESISRHQLFVNPQIPYTSQNISACLLVEGEDFEKLKALCRDFLIEDSVGGSVVGLCIHPLDEVNEEVIDWEKKANNTVLTRRGYPKSHSC